jgi:hypothetical protein
LSGLTDKSANILHISISVTVDGQPEQLTIFNQVFPKSDYRQPFKSLCSHHGIRHEISFEHVTCAESSAPKTEAKLPANALFHHISYYKIMDKT